MPDSIRDRLRRILNGDPAQRIARTDQIRRTIEAVPPAIEPASNPIDLSAKPSVSAAAASEQTVVSKRAATSEAKPVTPAAAASTTITQPSLPKINSAQPIVSEPSLQTKPVSTLPQPDQYQSPAVLRPIDHNMVNDVADAQNFIENLRQKMAALAEDFAMGHINRQQFESVYIHYREQRQMIEGLLTSMTSSAWRKAVSEGETAMLLKRSTAKVLSYALYDNESSVLLASSGNFQIDPGVVVPMLSAYRSATAEAFGAGIRNSEIEGGRWLTFVPGKHTTFIVLFSLQPARGQLDMLEDLHRDFETANVELLSEGKGQEAAEQFVRLWTLGRGG